MNYQEQYLNNVRLFSPTDYDQLEHLAQNTSTWRMTTFTTSQGHFSKHPKAFATSAKAAMVWNTFKIKQGQLTQHPKAFATNTKTDREWNIFKTTQGHPAHHNNCKEVA